MECSWNDGSKTQYYVVILDRLQDHSGGLEWAPESRIRGPLTVGIVARHVAAPGHIHMKAVKHIYHYLCGTSDYKLTYHATKDPNELVIYSDSDWAGD